MDRPPLDTGPLHIGILKISRAQNQSGLLKAETGVRFPLARQSIPDMEQEAHFPAFRHFHTHDGFPGRALADGEPLTHRTPRQTFSLMAPDQIIDLAAFILNW